MKAFPTCITVRNLMVLVLLLAGPGCRRREPQQIAYRPPSGPADPSIEHVILISIDTLRADYLACYGHPFVKTPNIDRLAAEGTLFEHQVCAAPTTLNSHTSLMTGTYAHTHGTPRNGYRVNEGNVMLAEVLKEKGFATAAFIGAFPLSSRFGFDQGFDHFDERFEIFTRKDPVDQDQRTAERVTDGVVAWLDRNRPRRMFLFVHYFDVHWPYDPPPPYDTMYRRDDRPFGGSLTEIMMVRKALHQDRKAVPERNAALRALYCGEVTYTDAQIGRLFEALRRRDLYDRSLIVLTSDHGEAMNEHWEIWDHGNSTYQTTVAAPLIIRQPGGKLGGRRLKNLLSNIDLMPTILDLLGIGQPRQVEGVSFAPLLKGQDLPLRQPVFSEATKPWGALYESDPVWANALKCRAVSTRRWKYVFRPIEMIEELYDLQADPQERNNLLDKPNREIIKQAAQLSDLLRAWTDSAKPLGTDFDESEETKRKLKGLGYLQDDRDSQEQAP